MNLRLDIVLFILFTHWVADFVLQSDWMAQNKSKNMKALLLHCLVYSGCFFSLIPFIGSRAIIFVAVTFILHAFVDFFTSRINAYNWSKNRVHYFFVGVGFDQFIHFTQLLYLFYFLNK